jgi:hypothetical protein
MAIIAPPSPIMQTRSATRNLQTNFDFDASSRAWRANKVYLGNGSFNYNDNFRNMFEPCHERTKNNDPIKTTPSSDRVLRSHRR